MIRLFIEKVLIIKQKVIRLKFWKVDFCRIEMMM